MCLAGLNYIHQIGILSNWHSYTGSKAEVVGSNLLHLVKHLKVHRCHMMERFPSNEHRLLFFIFIFFNPVFLILGHSPMVEVKLRMYVVLCPSRTIGIHV